MGKWKLPPDGGHMDKASKIYFQTMTKKDVEERLKKNDILLIPIGSTENHGAAGPYGEDTYIVTRMAELIAQRDRLYGGPSYRLRFTSRLPPGTTGKRDYPGRCAVSLSQGCDGRFLERGLSQTDSLQPPRPGIPRAFGDQ